MSVAYMRCWKEKGVGRWFASTALSSVAPSQFACCSAGILRQLLFSVLIFGFWYSSELQRLPTFSAV